MTYFAVLDAMGQQRNCFLCKLELDSINKYIDHLLYEQVNDVGIRKQLRESKGFCPRHSLFLLKRGKSLGLAILYREQVKFFGEFLDNLASITKRISKILGIEWKEHKKCPLCKLQMEARKRYVDVFVNFLKTNDVDMCRAFEETAPLCVPHFLYLIDKVKSNLRLKKYIINIEQSKLENLISDLNKFIRKYDYRYSSEPMGDERDSWQRAIRTIVGYEGLF